MNKNPLAEMQKQRDAANVAVGCLAADREAFAEMVVQLTAERDQARQVGQQLAAQLAELQKETADEEDDTADAGKNRLKNLSEPKG